MADIAAIFHWTPPVMDQMSLEELMDWHGRALKRNPNGHEEDDE